MNSERIDEFVIKNPRWILVVLLIVTVISAAIEIAVAISFALKVVNKITFIVVIIVFAFILLIGIIGIVACVKEKFIFKDERFTYVKVFKRAQTVKVEDIEKVIINYNFPIKVKIIDKDGKTSLNFLDDGTAFRNGKFIEVLKQRKIVVQEKQPYRLPWYLRF